MNNIMKTTFLLLTLCLAMSAFGQTRSEYKKSIKDHRRAYKAKFLAEERSPFFNRASAMKKMRFFKANPTYKVACTFTPSPDAQPFDMATYSGKIKPYVTYGILTFQLDGQQYQLAVYRNLNLMKIEAYADYLFLPFKDGTNNESTYGGGRYIDLKTSDIVGGKFLLDFNKCYNPWCAFSSGYNCPVPPKENHLSIPIKAGEKKYKRKKYDQKK